MGELVLRENLEEGIVVLTLNRPEVRNALSASLFVELRDHVDALAGEGDTFGCVILRGEGRSFSAGADLKAFQSGDKAPSRHFQAETLDALEQLPQVVIASVQGHCYTGSLELVLACDLMIAAESAKFADTHGKWSMTPTWGMSQRLPRRIGLLRARELMFTGRVVTGRESAEIGLANECVPDDHLEARTLEVARQIAANSWHSLRGDKMLLAGSLERGLQEGLAFERKNSPGAGPDMAERLKNF